MSDILEQAIANCANEPIHIPGSIQPFGALIAFDHELQYTSHSSVNAGPLLAKETSDVLGQPIVSYLPPKVIHNVRNALIQADVSKQRMRLGVQELPSGHFEMSLYKNPTQTVLELEPLPQERGHQPLTQLKTMLGQLQGIKGTEALLQAAVETLRWNTGFTRVMAYRFLHNGDGEVVAEECTWPQEPYLGLRYPASDIPPQARELFFSNPIRIISDVAASPVPLLAASQEEQPLDLSLSLLRAVSPVHIAYLENMGVTASMTLPLIVNQRLWGLLACHASEVSLHLRPELRSVCELFGQMLSLHLEHQLEKDKSEKRARIKLSQRSLHTTNQRDPQVMLASIEVPLKELLPSDGLALYMQGKWYEHGSTPPQEGLQALKRQIEKNSSAELLTYESLQDQIPHADFAETAGALAIFYHEPEPLYLVFFRDELLQEIRWGGDPTEKPITYGPHGPRLNPRTSFEAYAESVAGYCRPWQTNDAITAEELRSSWLPRLFQHEKETPSHHDIVVAELNHRVKNILALIQSLARQTRRHATSLEHYASTLEHRIAALALSHEHNTLAPGGGVSLKKLLSKELAPYLPKAQIAKMLQSDDVLVQPDASSVLSLIFHELVTNAVKYGALSSSDGDLSIEWRFQGAHLELHWRELGGPAVAPPTQRGFGTVLIERTIPYELHGKVDMRYPKHGLEVDIQLPSALFLPDESELLERPYQALKDANLETLSILILEDNALLAIDLLETLKELGCIHIEAAANLEQAEARLAEQPFDVALLDIQVGDGNSFALAHQAQAAGIPTAFVTGYETNDNLPPQLQHIPILQKPVQRHALHTFLTSQTFSPNESEARPTVDTDPTQE